MRSTIRFGLLAAICALGAFGSVAANADDRDGFRQRVYDRARANDQGHHRDRHYDRKGGRHDYARDRGRHDYKRHDYRRHDYKRDDYRRHDHKRHDYKRRDFDHRRDSGRYYFDRGHDHRHVKSRRHISYFDRFDRRFHPALKRGFYCDDFGHFRGRHYHVSRTDFYGSFYPKYPYRPFYDRGGRATVIVSIPF